MYTIAIGLSSRSRLLFGVALVLSISLAFAFGFVEQNGEPLSPIGISTMVAVGVVFFFHMLERYNRHVVDRIPFLEFIRREN